MLSDLSVILVVDIQSAGKAAPDPGEIIEIGIASVDTGALRIHQLDNLFVKPSQPRNGIRDEVTAPPEPTAVSAVPYNEACRIIKRRYLAPEVTWASWTSCVRTRFERQCRAHAIPFPFNASHITVSNLFALAHQLPREVEIAEAMDLARLSAEGPATGSHHAARNVARLLISVLQTCRRSSLVPANLQTETG